VKSISLLPIALLASVIYTTGTQAEERSRADTECRPTDQTLVYDCMIMLTGKNSGAPMDDVEFTVSANMPSMPMAHNVKPVKATPTGEQGTYRAKIELEMLGEWVLRMDISRPVRDTIINKLRFGASGVESVSGLN
jgi:hypothetical protein